MHDLETTADDARAAKALAHLFRRGVGGDVVILGVHADQQIAHGAANDIGFVAVLLQRFDSASATAADVFATDAVLGRTDDGGPPGKGCRLTSEDAGYEFTNHRLFLVMLWYDKSAS